MGAGAGPGVTADTGSGVAPTVGCVIKSPDGTGVIIGGLRCGLGAAVSLIVGPVMGRGVYVMLGTRGDCSDVESGVGCAVVAGSGPGVPAVTESSVASTVGSTVDRSIESSDGAGVDSFAGRRVDTALGSCGMSRLI